MDIILQIEEKIVEIITIQENFAKQQEEFLNTMRIQKENLLNLLEDLKVIVHFVIIL